ncbi:MAG: metallopeptidase TldD-related protein [Patescibacteria group bacterium]
MDTTKVAQDILTIAKRYGVEFCEVVATKTEISLKRIKQGQVDQPPAGEQWGIDLALVRKNRRKAVRFDNPFLGEELIGKMVAQMDLLPEQEIILPTDTFPSVSPRNELFNEKTTELDGEGRMITIKRVIQVLEKHGLFLSGKIAQARGRMTYENSLGVSQTMRFTLACAGLFAFDRYNPSVSAYASSGGISLDSLDTDRILRELVYKCDLARGKAKIDLFAQMREGEELKIDLIGEPYFFAPLFEWMGIFGFNGLFVEKGESFISGNIGNLITGSNVSIKDDPFDPRTQGMGIPFDFEGRPRKTLYLIEKGVARNAVYDNTLAKKYNHIPTGNALSPSFRSQGAVPFNLVIEGGNTSMEEMLANAIRPTLWVTKLHYPGMKHYQTATMTGVVSHGVFLIENGKVIGPVENVRFQESIPEAFKRIEAMSPSRLVFDPLNISFPGGVVVPAMKIKDFRFVGSTNHSV